jgi:hypothetical protein
MEFKNDALFEHFITSIGSKTEFEVNLKHSRALFTMHTMHRGEKPNLHMHHILANSLNIWLNLIRSMISRRYITETLTVFH